MRATVMYGAGDVRIETVPDARSIEPSDSVAQASVVAPFEYTPLLFNVMWGFVIWREVPTLTIWVVPC